MHNWHEAGDEKERQNNCLELESSTRWALPVNYMPLLGLLFPG